MICMHNSRVSSFKIQEELGNNQIIFDSIIMDFIFFLQKHNEP